MIEIKKIYNEIGIETGTILSSSFTNQASKDQIITTKKQLIDYAVNKLYRGEKIDIFLNINSNNPNLTIIRNQELIPSISVVI